MSSREFSHYAALASARTTTSTLDSNCRGQAPRLLRRDCWTRNSSPDASGMDHRS